MKYKNLFFLWLLSISTSCLFGQTAKSNQAAINTIETRIKILEGQKDNLNKQSELLQEEFKLKAGNLDAKFTENKLSIDQDLATVRWMIYAFGLGLIGTLIGYLFYFKNFIQKRTEAIAEEKIDSLLSNIVEHKKQELIHLIRSQDLENELRQKSLILVLCESEADKASMLLFFEAVKIKNVDYELSETFKTPASNYDLIIFNDYRDTKKNHDLFEEYIKELANTNMLFIFFGNRFNTPNRDKVNFANSKFTLYNQIMNSLKFNQLQKTSTNTTP